MPGLATSPRPAVAPSPVKGFRFPYRAVQAVRGPNDDMAGDRTDAPEGAVSLTVRDGDGETTIDVEPGRNLRAVLLEHGFDVYGRVSRHANCGGRGLCGTCGVRIEDGPEPAHWHDRAAARWGYPRLSCQVMVKWSMTVELVEKVVWGQLRPRP